MDNRIDTPPLCVNHPLPKGLSISIVYNDGRLLWGADVYREVPNRLEQPEMYLQQMMALMDAYYKTNLICKQNPNV